MKIDKLLKIMNKTYAVEGNPWNIGMSWIECIGFNSHFMMELNSFFIIGASNDVVSYFGRNSA